MLSKGDVDHENNDIIYYNKCLASLEANMSPKFSIANEFQIGETPQQLKDVILPEKLLIAKCRPKLYIVKLISTWGRYVQRGLKGNTITCPWNVVRMYVQSNLLRI